MIPHSKEPVAVVSDRELQIEWEKCALKVRAYSVLDLNMARE